MTSGRPIIVGAGPAGGRLRMRQVTRRKRWRDAGRHRKTMVVYGTARRRLVVDHEAKR